MEAATPPIICFPGFPSESPARNWGVPVSGRLTLRQNRFVLLPCAALAVLLAVGLASSLLVGQSERPPEFEPQPQETPQQRPPAGISMSADFAWRWTDGPLSVMLLRGNCRIRDGDTELSADSIVVWRRSQTKFLAGEERLLVYLEHNARIERPGATIRKPFLFRELTTTRGAQFAAGTRIVDRSAAKDPVYARAEERRKHSSDAGAIFQQTSAPIDGETDEFLPQLISLQKRDSRGELRRVRIFPRSEVSFSVHSFESKATSPPEQVWVLSGGVNMIVDGISSFGVIDLSADRMVVWTQTLKDGNFQSETLQSQDTPFEVYLEGNIVIRQGKNIIRATRAVYDARENRGLILDAHLKAFVPALGDSVRIRASRIRQLSKNSFHATKAWATTSKFGVPGYRLQASDIFLENRRIEPLFGSTRFDPRTGRPVSNEVQWMTSLNNVFYVEQLPVTYLPYVSAPAENPNIPLKRASAGYDRVFGGRLQTVWDAFGVFGIEQPRGVDWFLHSDTFTDRGTGLGTSGNYEFRDPFGIPGLVKGEGIIYGVYDEGRDNLGNGRRDLIPDNEERGRVRLRHRHDLPYGLTVIGEVGLISDRNFLEQYFEREFDRDKDNETLLYAKQQLDNFAWTGIARPQLNDFENTTEWLPRGDLYLLSEPFFDGRLTWSSHTSAGYGRLRVSEGPTDPTEIFTPLPFIADLDGAVLMTRHELNAPFSLGPVNFVPYVWGEAAYWDQGFARQDLDRYVGAAGLRGSLMFWRTFPEVYSEMFNLNGLAHKSLFEFDYSYTDSTQPLSAIPQYNEFDENAQERFRERFLTNTFGGVLPGQLEPRFYAVRTGAGSYVTAPYHELVADQQVLRLAWRNTLQTKVGPPERLRIKDWMSLDLEASFFPEAERDNFGEDIGLLGAFYRWNLSDQTTFLANAQYDLFENAPEIFNVGFITGRGERGNIYLGLRQVKGANLDSMIATASFSYQMSPKWIATAGTAYDLRENRNGGQSMTITRIGADFLVHVGANFDAGKNNAGFTLAIEPRLGALRNRLTRLGSLVPGTQAQ